MDAEAVDVTEGDATNTGDAQEKQVITFTRMVHVVAASEDEVPVYAAQELVLTQGEEDYDLTDDILYDDVKYTLEVVSDRLLRSDLFPYTCDNRRNTGKWTG